MAGSNETLVIFDNTCNLCCRLASSSAAKGSNLKYIGSDSKEARRLLKNYDVEEMADESVIFYDKGKAYLKSEAVLRILISLGGIRRAAVVFRIIPVAIRDFFYDIVARNRFRWFGKNNGCNIPYK